VYDRYPCQRAINIVFMVAALLLLLFTIVGGVRLALYLTSLSANGGGGVSSMNMATSEPPPISPYAPPPGQPW